MRSKVLEISKVQQIFLLAFFYFVSVNADKLEPKYDDGDNFKIFRIGQPLVLQCKPKAESDGKLIYWTKGGENVTENHDENSHHHVTIVHKDGKLVYEKAMEENAGLYRCNIFNEEKENSLEFHEFDVTAQAIVKVSMESSQITEDNDVVLVCIVKGTDPEMTWYYKPETENDIAEYAEVIKNDRLSIEIKDTNDQILTIKKAQLSDRGFYRCNATNARMKAMDIPDASDEKFVRIKDKMAPLWPAIGIVAQIVVLALIIVISEKRRKQDEVDESDTDEGPEKKEEANFIRNRN